MIIVKKIIPFIIIILSFWAVKPFFSAGFFPIHDDTQVSRVFEMEHALLDGMLPVRWVPDLGYNYGYPIFNFYAPFAYYIGGFINLVGFDSLSATKIMMVFGIILAGFFMYFLAREFWGELGGIVSGLLYVYSPYHALDVYVRGDIAEFWAYAFIPLAFFGIYKLFTLLKSYSHETDHIKHIHSTWLWIAITALAYAAIILSHNLTAMMITPFLLSAGFIFYFFLTFRTKTRKAYFILLSLLVGILLSAFYWLPVFGEMHYTNVISQIGGESSYRDHFVCLSQLWESQWGFGGSAPGCIDGLSFRVGKMHIILALLSLGSLVFLWRISRAKFAFVLFAVFSTILAIFLMLNYSEYIWHTIAPMDFFQFPWRFLIIVSFFTSFLSGALLWILQRKMLHHYVSRTLYIMISFILIAVVIWFNAKLFVPQFFVKKTTADYTNMYMLRWVTSRISDEYMPQGFSKPKNPSEVPQKKMYLEYPGGQIISYHEKTQQVDTIIQTTNTTKAIFAIAYFPAWHVFIDGRDIQFTILKKGMEVVVPPGTHKLSAVFIQTPLEQLGNGLSLAGILVLIIGIISTRKKKSYGKKN